jgi:TfoX/Sxy family transcriptional regulator of competence genes
MAYEETLAARLRQALVKKKLTFSEMKMFGGLAIMVRGHMCCGVLKNELVARVNPERTETLLKQPHARPMDFTGKPMKGFVMVGAKGIQTDKQLGEWVKESSGFVLSLPPKESKKLPLKRSGNRN